MLARVIITATLLLSVEYGGMFVASDGAHCAWRGDGSVYEMTCHDPGGSTYWCTMLTTPNQNAYSYSCRDEQGHVWWGVRR